jgi:hypothetical protein
MSAKEKPRKPLTDIEEWERLKVTAKEQARLATFEGRIERLESVCLKTPGILPNRAIDNPPPEHSRAWYAEEILLAIRSTRHHLDHSQAEYAAGEAILIGALAAEAEARHNWPEVRQWRNLCQRNRELAQKRGRSVSDAADARACEIRDAAAEYRRLHPYHSRNSSTRALARHVAHELGVKLPTVRGHLRKLSIR